MRYEETKKLMMQAYPRLYVDEADVLHQLFAVNGNGYEWVNGELTTGQTAEEFLAEGKRCDEDCRRMWKESNITNARITKEIYEELRKAGIKPKREHPIFPASEFEISDDPAVERRKERKKRRKYAKDDTLAQDTYFLRPDGSVGRTLYPLCQYADILHTPEDVKPDWLAAACKAVMVFRTEFKCTKEDLKWLKKAEALLRTRSKNSSSPPKSGRPHSSTKRSKSRA